jgi:uncharacterized protein YndB with AHSA1/START domain
MKISKSIWVKRSVDDAFRLFTDQIGSWWPLKEGFSYAAALGKTSGIPWTPPSGEGAGRARPGIFLEARLGGRFYERFTDGTEYEVGRVIECEPPTRFVVTWKSPDWEGSTEVEVRFAPERDGTRLDLEHRGFEVGPKVAATSKGFDGGWVTVLARYAAAA